VPEERRQAVRQKATIATVAAPAVTRERVQMAKGAEGTDAEEALELRQIAAAEGIAPALLFSRLLPAKQSKQHHSFAPLDFSATCPPSKTESFVLPAPAMQFTTQQLIGGARYSTKTRIGTGVVVRWCWPLGGVTRAACCNPAGNWSEDEARFDVAAQDYQQKKAKGDLLHLKKQRQKLLESQAVPHTYSADGLLRYGDCVQLACGVDSRRCVLAANLFLPVKPGHARVTATEATDAQARNVFVLLRPSGAPGRPSAAPVPPDDVIRFGDRLHIATNPSLTADPETRTVGLQSLLTSQRVSNVIGAGRKGRQEATLCARRCADAEWVVVAADGDRLATDGTPVPVGEPVCLVHAMTNEALAAVPGETYPTDFGERRKGGWGILSCSPRTYAGALNDSILPSSPARPLRLQESRSTSMSTRTAAQVATQAWMSRLTCRVSQPWNPTTGRLSRPQTPQLLLTREASES
jgi:hypothetical protein